MKTLRSIAEYYKEIGVSPPKHAFFDVRRHEENIDTIKQKQLPVKHELYSISILTQPVADLSIHDRPIVARLFIVSPFKIVQWDNLGVRVQGMYIVFDREFVGSNVLWQNFLTDFTFFKHEKLATDDLPLPLLQEILYYFQRIHIHYHEASADKFELIKAMVHLVLLLLKRHFDSPRKTEFRLTTNNKLLADFESLLLETLAHPELHSDFRQPSFYAARLHVHTNHLNAVIKQLTGKTTSEMIQEHIIQQVCILLRQKDQTVKGVAAHFGFYATTHFIAFFKKHTRQTPGQYQSAAGIL